MILTEHFTTEEFIKSSTATRRGINNAIPGPLLGNAKMMAEALEKIRAHYGKPMVVTSCYRSPELNKAVGGSKTSSHCHALAADFTVTGESNIDVCRKIPELLGDFDQVINEFPESGGWIHLGLTTGDPRGMILTARKINGKTTYTKGL
ncbi:MAG: D-Ala-D-Ala carboxypeptidase family metallohydrolase [Desulfuromonadaceae bacterium]